MANYARKTCYDCGIKNPANMMERVTESYNSGRSDNKVTAGNLAFAMVSDTAAKKVKKTVVANNRRSYTRNRTVWKCLDCSGHNEAVAQNNAVNQAKIEGKIRLSEGQFAALQVPMALYFLFFLGSIFFNWLFYLNLESSFFWTHGLLSFGLMMVSATYQNKREEAIAAIKKRQADIR